MVSEEEKDSVQDDLPVPKRPSPIREVDLFKPDKSRFDVDMEMKREILPSRATLIKSENPF